jgi:hypothetical protein
MWAAIIGGICGLLTGVLGAILAPWAKWRVDREQATREWRRERLEEWRTGLAVSERLPDALDDRDFLQTAWYASLRQHLSDEDRRRLEFTPGGPVTIIVGGGGSIGTSSRASWRTGSTLWHTSGGWTDARQTAP